MSAKFAYSLEQKTALLRPIGRAGSHSWVVVAVTEEARRAIEEREEHRKAPRSKKVIERLARFAREAERLEGVLRRLNGDLDRTPAESRGLLLELKRLGLDWEGLASQLATFAEAARRANAAWSREDNAFMIDGVVRTKRGAPDQAAAHSFGFRIAIIWRLATGRHPTVPNDKINGRATGPFVAFVEAAARPAGLIRGARRIDALARFAVAEYKIWRAFVANSEMPTTEDNALRCFAEAISAPAPEVS